MKGFTFVELVIVVFLLALLAAFSLQGYGKMFESSNAEKARELTRLVANSNRNYALSREGMPFLAGSLNGCDPTQRCENSLDACRLLTCGYLAAEDWTGTRYDYYALNGPMTLCGLSGTPVSDPSAAPLFEGPSGRFYIACAKRRSDAGSPYVNWGYTVNLNGGIQAWPASDPPPLKQE